MLLILLLRESSQISPLLRKLDTHDFCVSSEINGISSDAILQ